MVSVEGEGRTGLLLARPLGPGRRDRHRCYPDTWSAIEQHLWSNAHSRDGGTLLRSCGAIGSPRCRPPTKAAGGYGGSPCVARMALRCGSAFIPDGPADYGSHPKNGYASATPATDGRRYLRLLWLLVGSLPLIWRARSPGRRKIFGPFHPYHGPAGSLLLLRGPDHSLSVNQGRRLRSLPHSTRLTGKPLWRTERRGQRSGPGHTGCRQGCRSRRDHRQQPEHGARA